MPATQSDWLKWETHKPIRPTDLSRTPSLARFPQSVAVAISETDDTIRIGTQGLNLLVGKNPWSLLITDVLDNAIVRDTPKLPSNPPDAPRAMYGSVAFRLDIPERGLWRQYHDFSNRSLWFHATSVHKWEQVEQGIQLICITNDPFSRQLIITIRFLSENIFELQAIVSDRTSLTAMAHSFNCSQDESFYGLGERFTACNQYGQEVMAWSSAGPTGRRDWTYWPTPFVMTGSHYGILLDSTYRNRFRLCSDFKHAWNFETEGPELVYQFIYDPDPLKIIEGLTDLVGKPPLPPKWSFGVIRNMNGSEDKVLLEAHKLREANIPCSALWYYDSLDEERHIAWPINPHFYDGNYSDIADLNRKLKTLGYNAQTYLFPYVYVGTKNFEGGAQGDYFVKNRYGEVYLIPFHAVDNTSEISKKRMAGIIDFTNPEAVTWYQEIIRQIIIELDFDGWMHDFGEDVPADAVFYNGKTGAEMHNVYPVLYKKATYEACMRHKPEVSYYARAGYAGSQGYTMALWTGDQIINWSYDDGLPSVIPGALNLGMCGCPYIGPDIAGYFHSENHPSVVSEELWIRWLQLGAMTPVMRDLIAYYPIELWTSQQTEEAFRTYARLHISLFPYLYTYAHIAHSRGIPIMQHLYLMYPDDTNVKNLDYQYLLGNELLVAPVLKPGVNKWSVYLPEGEWISWWDGSCYQGSRHVTVPAPLMQIPLFVKAGSIIPQLPADIDTLLPSNESSIRTANDDLVIDVYPLSDGNSSFELWDETIFEWNAAQLTLTIEKSPVMRDYTIHIHGLPSIESVTAEEQEAEIELQWHINEDNRFVVVNLHGRNPTVVFTVSL